MTILARWPHRPSIDWNPSDLLIWKGVYDPFEFLLAVVALVVAYRSIRRAWCRRRDLLLDRE
jgi:hypothetical protein